MGDVPLLDEDRFHVGNGRDALGRLGLDGIYVVEFLKGQSNEFIIEPEKLPNNLCKDEFSAISDYDGAWWLASIAVLAFLTF